jgi:hypothetical protein
MGFWQGGRGCFFDKSGARHTRWHPRAREVKKIRTPRANGGRAPRDHARKARLLKNRPQLARPHQPPSKLVPSSATGIEAAAPQVICSTPPLPRSGILKKFDHSPQGHANRRRNSFRVPLQIRLRPASISARQRRSASPWWRLGGSGAGAFCLGDSAFLSSRWRGLDILSFLRMLE